MAILIHVATNVKASLANLKRIGPISREPFQLLFWAEHYGKIQGRPTVWQKCLDFSTLAILIACLGLFGLSSLTVLQRTKEIG